MIRKHFKALADALKKTSPDVVDFAPSDEMMGVLGKLRQRRRGCVRAVQPEFQA